MAKRTWFWVALVAAAAVAVWVGETRTPPPGALVTWSSVVAVVPSPRGLSWTDLSEAPAVREALQGTDPDALRNAMEVAGVRALWVGTSPDAAWGPEVPLVDQFTASGVVRGFRGVHLAPEGQLYAIDRTTWPTDLAAKALGRAARQILEGGDPPPIDAFPPALRRRQGVEVLVLLRAPMGPRLWRSARAESIAEGLNMAALAARKRWEERRETMGGPLAQRLDHLDVEVALLFDDGTIAPTATSLIDPMIKPMHGVAYEQPSRWRYVLPLATHAEASPTEAYRVLFVDNGLPSESFGRADLRLYRMRMKTLSVDYGSNRAVDPSGSGAGRSPELEGGDNVSNDGSSSSAGNRTTKVVPNP